jgi:hypothetical protein
MLATPESQKLALAIAPLAAAIVALAARKGKRGVAFIGAMFGFIGIIGLVSGTIPQRWRGGPPLEGSLATFGSLVIFAIGLYIIFLAFFQKSDDHSQRK